MNDLLSLRDRIKLVRDLARASFLLHNGWDHLPDEAEWNVNVTVPWRFIYDLIDGASIKMDCVDCGIQLVHFAGRFDIWDTRYSVIRCSDCDYQLTNAAGRPPTRKDH